MDAASDPAAHAPRSPRLRGRAGFSLIEALLALALLSAVIVPVMRVFGALRRQADLVVEGAEADVAAESRRAEEASPNLDDPEEDVTRSGARRSD